MNFLSLYIDVYNVLSVQEKQHHQFFNKYPRTSDVTPGICWSHSSSVGVTASTVMSLSSPGPFCAFTVHIYFSCSFSPWYFFPHLLMLLLLSHLLSSAPCQTPMCQVSSAVAACQSGTAVAACQSGTQSPTGSWLCCSKPLFVVSHKLEDF